MVGSRGRMKQRVQQAVQSPCLGPTRSPPDWVDSRGTGRWRNTPTIVTPEEASLIKPRPLTAVTDAVTSAKTPNRRSTLRALGEISLLCGAAPHYFGRPATTLTDSPFIKSGKGLTLGSAKAAPTNPAALTWSTKGGPTNTSLG